MPNYRYSPRQFLERPELFGRREDAVWDPVAMAKEARAVVAASYFQHVAACTVVAKAQHAGDSVVKIAGKLDVVEGTLRRKPYGESPARLDDLIGWALVYGVDVLPPVESTDDLFPRCRSPSDSTCSVNAAPLDYQEGLVN